MKVPSFSIVSLIVFESSLTPVASFVNNAAFGILHRCPPPLRSSHALPSPTTTHNTHHRNNNNVMPTTSPSSSSSLSMAVALEAEPEGGDELTSIDSMPGSRMKKMDLRSDVTSDDGGDVYEFWLTASVDGSLIKTLRTQVLKDASKNANFPGFRKGQIPPYAQPQMTQFAVQEGLIQTIEAAVGAYGLKSLKGSDGAVDVKEDLKEMCKGYNVGDDIAFTATLKATFDPEKMVVASPSEEEEGRDDDGEDGVIDVTAETDEAVTTAD